MVCLYFVKSPSGCSYNDIGLLTAYASLPTIVTVSKGVLCTFTIASPNIRASLENALVTLHYQRGGVKQ